MKAIATILFAAELLLAAVSFCAADDAPPSPIPVPLSPSLDLHGKVVGPEGDTIASGQLTKLKAALTVTRDSATTVLLESPLDNCPTAYQWELTNPPAGYNVADWIGDDGRTLTFAASVKETTRFDFVLGISKWTGSGKPLLRLTRYTLTVRAGPGTTDTTPTGKTPKTPTDTTPKTPKTPVDPQTPNTPETGDTDDQPPPINGLFGLAPKVRDPVGRLVPAKYQHHAAGLAGVYRDAALMVKNNELTPTNAAKKLSELNATVLDSPAAVAAWAPFFAWLGKEMGVLATAGKLLSRQNVVQALSEISLGLSLVEPAKVEEE